MESTDPPYWFLQLTTTYLSNLSSRGLSSRKLCFGSLAALTVLNSIYHIPDNKISGNKISWTQSQSKKFLEAREHDGLFF